MSIDDVDRAIVLSYAARIPWDRYVGAGSAPGSAGANIFLEASDVELIKRFSALEAPAMTVALASEPTALLYPQALLKVLLNITDVRVLQYTLTLIVDFLEADPEKRAQFFFQPGAAAGSPVFTLPFLQLVGTGSSGARISSVDANPYVLEHAAKAAALLIAVDQSDESSLSGFLAWILTNIKLFGSLAPRQVKVTEVATEALLVLLRSDYIRTLFVEEKGVDRLIPMLSSMNTQLLYIAAACLWLISLHKPTPEPLKGAVAPVARLCRVGMPVKVQRMCLALLVTVCKSPSLGPDALAEVCDSHVPEVVSALLNADPRINDQELQEDLRWMHDAIVTSGRAASTSIERYRRELSTRRLEWSAVHTPEFWRDNCTEFEADGFELIGKIGELLMDPASDDVTLAVALHDLGQFAATHPKGRTIVGDKGLKPVVMDFLTRRDEDDVKQQALLAMSKLMVARWQQVGAGTSGGGK